MTSGSKQSSSQNGASDPALTGVLAGRRTKAQRKAVPARRAVKAASAAAIAAALAAGAAAYTLTEPSHPSQARLTSALSAPSVIDAFSHSGVGQASAVGGALMPQGNAESAPVPVARATVTLLPARPAAPKSAAPRSSQSPAPVATATAAPAAPSASQSAGPATPAPTTPTTPSASSTPSAPTASTVSAVSCSDNSSLLPANVTAIVSFLLANGYSDNAAAGIAGNIYQESKGDPESVGSGGGGLIGFTPLPGGYVTGNSQADLQTQLNAVLTYNQIWASFIPELNSAASPADAASIYVTDFERAGIPAASTREASAEAVASACNI